MDKGWIKIHRSILDWQWYNDFGTFKVFMHLVLTANIEDKQWQGITIKRGQLVTSVASLTNQTGLSTKQIRTILKRLTNCNSVEIETTNKYSIVTICNYDSYQYTSQCKGQTNGKQRANKGQQLKNIRTKEDLIIVEEKENKNKEKENLNVVSSDDDYFEDMKTNAIWRNVICMKSKLTEQQLDEYLCDFYLECQCKGATHSNVNHTRTHFFNWLLIQTKKPKQQNEKSSILTNEDLDAIVEAGYKLSGKV